MPEMMTMNEASAESGISYGTIRRWILSGQFCGFVRAGNKILINMDRFKDFLNGCDSDE